MISSETGKVTSSLLLRIFEARDDLWWACRTLWHLAQAATYLGEWDASLSYCKRALEHGNTLEDLRLKVVGLYRTGAAHIQRGNIERGLRYCDEALALRPIPYDVAMAKVFRGYGQVKAGRPEDGIADLSDAINWLDRSGLRHVRLAPVLRLAEGHLRLGRFASERELVEEVLVIAQARGYRYLEGLARRLMAECIAETSPAIAEEHLTETLRIFDSIGARNDLAKTLVTRATLCQNHDKLVARRMLEEAGAIFESLGTLDEPIRVKAALDRIEVELFSAGYSSSD